MLPRSWSSVAQAGRQLVLVILLTYSVMTIFSCFKKKDKVMAEDRVEDDTFHTRRRRLEGRMSSAFLYENVEVKKPVLKRLSHEMLILYLCLASNRFSSLALKHD